MSATLPITGTLAVFAGLLLLFLAWRRKAPRTGMWRLALPASWGLLGAGMLAWSLSTHADQGLALGVVVVMMLACGLVAWQGLRQVGQPVKVQTVREIASDSLALGAGYWGRVVVRLAGSVVVVPGLGFAVGGLWYTYGPGHEADRLMGMAMASLIFAAAGWVIQLASRRPWRACLGLALVTVVAAGLAFLPRVL